MAMQKRARRFMPAVIAETANILCSVVRVLPAGIAPALRIERAIARLPRQTLGRPFDACLISPDALGFFLLRLRAARRASIF